MLPIPCVAPILTKEKLQSLPEIHPLGLHPKLTNETSTISKYKVSTLSSLDKLIQDVELYMWNFDNNSVKIQNPQKLLNTLREINNDARIDSVKSYIVDHVIYLIHNPDSTRVNTILSGPSGENKQLVASYLTAIWNSLGFVSNNTVRTVSRQQRATIYQSHIT